MRQINFKVERIEAWRWNQMTFPLLLCTRCLTRCFLKIGTQTAWLQISHVLCVYHFLMYIMVMVFWESFFLTSLTFVSFLRFLVWDEWKILMLSFVHKSLECLNYELPKFRYDLWCACLLLISTLFCSPFKISDWSADIDHSCILLLESLKLFWSLSLSALWVAYPFRQYNFPMLDCLQLSSQAAYPCRLSLHNAALFYLLSFILFSITGLQNLCKRFSSSLVTNTAWNHQLLFHPGF